MIAGRYPLHETREKGAHPDFEILLAIQPGGNKLLTSHKGLTVFNLPEQTPEQN